MAEKRKHKKRLKDPQEIFELTPHPYGKEQTQSIIDCIGPPWPDDLPTDEEFEQMFQEGLEMLEQDGIDPNEWSKSTQEEIEKIYHKYDELHHETSDSTHKNKK